jgi:hypothetical protein
LLPLVVVVVGDERQGKAEVHVLPQD